MNSFDALEALQDVYHELFGEPAPKEWNDATPTQTPRMRPATAADIRKAICDRVQDLRTAAATAAAVTAPFHEMVVRESRLSQCLYALHQNLPGFMSKIPKTEQNACDEAVSLIHELFKILQRWPVRWFVKL